ncbi:MAG: fasciclin domain-containing protein, partial [Balneolaceae bacterium]|nr:fasciclin domain-containing protein [Balneolaceae bacterium]
MRLNVTRVLLSSIVIFIAAAGCSLDNGTDPQQSANIIDTARQFDPFQTFVELADSSGTDKLLSQSGPVTAFIPTDEAFEKVPDSIFARMSSDQVAELLSYHVMEEVLFAGTIV